MSNSWRVERVVPNMHSELSLRIGELIVSEFYYDSRRGERPSAPEVLGYINDHAYEKATFYALIDESGTVYSAAAVSHNNGGKTTRVHELVTHCDWRRLGLARRVMLEGVAAGAKMAGDETIRLCSEPDARNFYRQLGFMAVSPTNPCLDANVAALLSRTNLQTQ